MVPPPVVPPLPVEPPPNVPVTSEPPVVLVLVEELMTPPELRFPVTSDAYAAENEKSESSMNPAVANAIFDVIDVFSACIGFV
jgi:hypothetical protein